MKLQREDIGIVMMVAAVLLLPLWIRLYCLGIVEIGKWLGVV